MTELWQLGAGQIIYAIQNRKASSREVVESHLERIGEINPALNAITVVLEETALDAADLADKNTAKGAPSPLCGIPITIKENQDVAGSATTLGLTPLKNAIATSDSPHIAALRQAGAIPIARTNMPEFGMRWHTTNGIYGPTLNPRDQNLTPGGSSGGEAAAIASGMSPLGIGNDGAGSLRWPAQCCGITALKPSHGRIPVASYEPNSPIPFAFQLLGVHGPMARHVEDLELALAHMCSTTSSDPWHLPAPVHQQGRKSDKTIGIVTNLEMDQGIEDALARAADMLRDAGYQVDEVELPSLQRASEIYTQIMDRYGRLTPEPQRAPVGVISAEYDQFWAAFNDPWKAAAGEATHDPMMERGMI
ncbi:MAG: amidase family protein [Pseudomonadota bacterium]